MKIFSIILSAILLFGTLNTAFSQTISSTDQCKTVMHEQIVKRKIDGKLRLEKIQVPMKICKATDEMFKKKLTNQNRSIELHKKISDSLQKLVESGQEKIIISIRGNGTIPDFRPIKSSGEHYGMPDLTQEQRTEVMTKRNVYVKELQKNLVKFITDNGGKITYRDKSLNILFAEVPANLIKDLEKRSDVLDIDRGDKMRSASKIQKKISDPLQKLIASGKERINIVISVNGSIPDFRPKKPSGEYYGMPDLTQEQRDEVMAKRLAFVKESQKNVIIYIENNDGMLTYRDGLLNSFYAEVPSALVKDLVKRSDVSSMDIGDRKFSIPILRAK